MGLEISEEKIKSILPSTRYQGSKRKMSPWIYESLRKLDFDTVLDGFGGTGSVSYLFKMMGKKVTFNDILLSNYQTGIALIENNKIELHDGDVNYLIHENGFDYPSFIQKVFKDIYYLDNENVWLDIVVHNIYMLSEKYKGDVLRKKQALAFHALFQACLSKRPYNLFHRRNLYMRTANVQRKFGNKKTWDTPFDALFVKFCKEVSDKVFSNKRRNIANCTNMVEMNGERYDLVYLDPPYIKSKQDMPVDYRNLYHFLEGIMDYYHWDEKIDYTKKNKPLIKNKRFWDKGSIEANFDNIFNNFQDSIIVLSYGDPVYPSIETIKELLYSYKNKVIIKKKEYMYKLNHSGKNGNKLYEVLLIAQ
jgi:adenine-specific DNA methylase